MLRYREIVPAEALRGFVSTFWMLEHDGEDPAPQRVVPDGHAELILNWRQPFECFQDGVWRGQPRYFLAGQLDGPILLRPGGPARMLGIGFLPHGAARLFGPIMHQLSGRFTAIDDIEPALLNRFQDALETPDPIAAVEAILLSVSNRVRGRDRLIEEAARRIALGRGNSRLPELARDLGISTRQLERRFQSTVGIAPKVFGRIQRFTSVFRALGDNHAGWAETALDCGYYDQAHLIRDFKDLSGATPAVLLSDDADLARHFYSRFGLSLSSNTALPVSS